MHRLLQRISVAETGQELPSSREDKPLRLIAVAGGDERMGMALPKTRLDKLVQIRERREDTALDNLARAQMALSRAQQRLSGAIQSARADHRKGGQAALWAVEELAHVRALQGVRAAQGLVLNAANERQTAQAGYVEAHLKAEAARRVADRKRAEIVKARDRAERRRLDEIASARFNRTP